MTPARAIATLLSLAIMLAGPVSAFVGAFGDCCCTSATNSTSVERSTADRDCCSSEPTDRQPSPERDHQDCDCTMPCCTAGKTMPLVRAFVGLDLPDAQPDTLTVREPESHAVEAHFSLLRPPRS